MISSQMDVFKKLPYIKSNINSKNAGGVTPRKEKGVKRWMTMCKRQLILLKTKQVVICKRRDGR